jgi:ribonuclease VapC
LPSGEPNPLVTSWVLDASALLALLHQEPGAARVTQAVKDGAAISAVNLSEVIGKLSEASMPEAAIRAALDALGLDVVAFTTDAAYQAGLLRPLTRQAGLSLGDRTCLALGQWLGLPVLTADRSWASLPLGVTVEVIR